MSAGRLVDRAARPAVRRRTIDLVAITPEPAPVTTPPSASDEHEPQPSRRSEVVERLDRRDREVEKSFESFESFESFPPRGNAKGRAPISEAAVPPARQNQPRRNLRRQQRDPVEKPAPPLAATSAPASASSTGRTTDVSAPSVPEVAIETDLVLPTDPAVEAPGMEAPEAEPVAVFDAPVIEAPPTSVRPATRGPVSAPPGSIPTLAAPPPPPVVIERIEVVTPPARPSPVDPLASMAERRAGRLRHGAAR